MWRVPPCRSSILKLTVCAFPPPASVDSLHIFVTVQHAETVGMNE